MFKAFYSIGSSFSTVCEKHREALLESTNGLYGFNPVIDFTPPSEQTVLNAPKTPESRRTCRKCENFSKLRKKKEVVLFKHDEYCRYILSTKIWETKKDSFPEFKNTCVSSGSRRCVVFSSESFEHPELMQNEFIMEDFGPPVLKGRPRKRKQKAKARTKQGRKRIENGDDNVNRRTSNRTKSKPDDAGTSGNRDRHNSTSSSNASVNGELNLRRSKRKRNNSSNDLKIALQNSLLDQGPNPPCNLNVEKKSRKRKSSPSLSASSTATQNSGKTRKGKRKRKRNPSGSSASSSGSSYGAAAQLSPEAMENNKREIYVRFFENVDMNDENSFLDSLMGFSKYRGTPIKKIPSCGFIRSECLLMFLFRKP